MVNKDKKHQTEVMALRRKIRHLEKRNKELSEHLVDEQAKNVQLEYELDELRKVNFERLKRKTEIERIEHDLEYWKELAGSLRDENDYLKQVKIEDVWLEE